MLRKGMLISQHAVSASAQPSGAPAPPLNCGIEVAPACVATGDGAEHDIIVDLTEADDDGQPAPHPASTRNQPHRQRQVPTDSAAVSAARH